MLNPNQDSQASLTGVSTLNHTITQNKEKLKRILDINKEDLIIKKHDYGTEQEQAENASDANGDTF